MSERGTFVTSYLYDWPNLAPVLSKMLPRICREGTLVHSDHEAPLGSGVFMPRFFAGLMHGGYGGEEAHMMEAFIQDELLPELPEKHGQFSIVVMPEWDQHSVVFSIKDRHMTVSAMRMP